MESTDVAAAFALHLPSAAFLEVENHKNEGGEAEGYQTEPDNVAHFLLTNAPQQANKCQNKITSLPKAHVSHLALKSQGARLVLDP